MKICEKCGQPVKTSKYVGVSWDKYHKKHEAPFKHKPCRYCNFAGHA